MSAPTRVTISIDVEGDYGTAALQGVDLVLPRLCDEFETLGVRAVFFVVGQVAEQRPAAIRALHDRGHVVGSHSMTHPQLGNLDPAQRKAELRDSRQVLQEVVGAACECFRAPFFDAPADLGALLQETGYRWSSSRAPFSAFAWRRNAQAPRGPHRWPGTDVLELPVPRLWGLPIPDGLSYRRLLWPLSALPGAAPSMFYLHPYELLDDVPNFAYRPWLRPLLTLRRGEWAMRHLRTRLQSWQAQGAVFAPPDLDALRTS